MSEAARNSRRRYLRRLAKYVFANKPLLAIVVIMGSLGAVLPFAYPYIIGHLIDDVIVPQPVHGVALTSAGRTHSLIVLITMAAATAVLFGITSYGRHFMVKLGNRVVVQIRRDLFDHLQRLSLHFIPRNAPAASSGDWSMKYMVSTAWSTPAWYLLGWMPSSWGSRFFCWPTFRCRSHWRFWSSCRCMC